MNAVHPGLIVSTRNVKTPPSSNSTEASLAGQVLDFANKLVGDLREVGKEARKRKNDVQSRAVVVIPDDEPSAKRRPSAVPVPAISAPKPRDQMTWKQMESVGREAHPRSLVNTVVEAMLGESFEQLKETIEKLAAFGIVTVADVRSTEPSWFGKVLDAMKSIPLRSAMMAIRADH